MIIVLSGCRHNKIADITIDKVSDELASATKKYDELYDFHEGLAKVSKGKKIGFIDKLGNEIIPCKFDEASEFQLGVSQVKIGEKEGLINMQGEWKIPCEFDFINPIGKDSLMVVSLDGKASVYDVTGKQIVPFEYDYIYDFNEGLAPVSKDGLYGFINKLGELIIPCEYEDLYNGIGFCEGLAGVKKDGKFGFINKTGDIIIPFSENLTGQPFSHGLTTIHRGGVRLIKDSKGRLATDETPFEMAFINKDGTLACDFFRASNVQEFRDGYSVITDEHGQSGLIDINGRFVIPCEYSFIANGFDDKYVYVEKYSKGGFIRKNTGEIVIPFIYEMNTLDGWSFNEGLVPVKKSGKYGFINEENEVVIPFEYDGAGAFSEGFAVVTKFGKYGYIDRYGKDTFY